MAGIPLSPTCSFCPNMYLYPSGEDVREEGAEGVPEGGCQEVKCSGSVALSGIAGHFFHISLPWAAGGATIWSGCTCRNTCTRNA